MEKTAPINRQPTEKQAIMLRWVKGCSPMGVTMARLAQELGWSKAATMGMLSKMKKRGWVGSSLSIDRHYYYITAAGRASIAVNSPSTIPPPMSKPNTISSEGLFSPQKDLTFKVVEEKGGQLHYGGVNVQSSPASPSVSGKRSPRAEVPAPRLKELRATARPRKLKPAELRAKRRVFGAAICAARMREDITQKKLSQMMRIPQTRIGNAEFGAGSLNVLMQIADFLGLEFVLKKKE